VFAAPPLHDLICSFTHVEGFYISQPNDIESSNLGSYLGDSETKLGIFGEAEEHMSIRVWSWLHHQWIVWDEIEPQHETPELDELAYINSMVSISLP
jgi:hypothetical protein